MRVAFTSASIWSNACGSLCSSCSFFVVSPLTGCLLVGVGQVLEAAVVHRVWPSCFAIQGLPKASKSQGQLAKRH